MSRKLMRRLKVAAFAAAAVVVVLAASFFIYTQDYYRADSTAVKIVTSVDSHIKKLDSITVFYPDAAADRGSGLIFYPGGKVEADAYAPILKRLSQKGVTCVLVRMPFNLAVFDVNAADRVYGMLPEIKSWYIGGHSLGGAMASSYAVKNEAKIKGVVLLGAYPTGSLNIPVLALYGSEDGVLDRTKLNGIGDVVEIEGGNHAYFGDYGEQKGDGTATITRDEQQTIAADAIMNFIYGKAD
jgi:hypothetical protein